MIGRPFRLLALALVLTPLLAGCAALDPEPIAFVGEPGCNPLASTGECLFPFPSRFFEQPDPSTPTGVRWSYPDRVLPVPEGTTAVRLERFNLADGASPIIPILVHFGVDIDPLQLRDQAHTADSLAAGEPIALFDLDAAARVPILTEMDQNLRGREDAEGRHALIIRPMVPMAMGHRHALAIRLGLRDAAGRAIAAPAGFVALRDGERSANASIEAARADYEELFALLAEQGYPRAELLLAWDFAVASSAHVLGPILSMRAQALGEIDDVGHSYTITDVASDPNENTAAIIEGDFEVPCFLDANNEIERAADGEVVRQGSCTYPFTVVVPAVAHEQGGLRFTLFGHGIFGSGRDYLEGSIGTDILQPLAQQGASVVAATDWIGLSEDDLALIMDQVVSDLNRISIVTDRLQQSLINNLVLIDLVLRELQYDPALDFGHGPLLGSAEVGYYGVSLGGIQGTSLTSLSRNIDRAVLAVPGGAWSTMLPRSVVFKPIKTFADLEYPDPLLQLSFISFLQGAFDFSDPINLGRLAYAAPLADAPPGRLVLYQEAVGDCQVPNLATRMVARMLGLAQLAPPAEPVFGLASVSAPTTSAALTQYVMPEALAEYTPPDVAAVPAEDNGVHSSAVQLPSALAQVVALLVGRTIEQPCDGVCDPD